MIETSRLFQSRNQLSRMIVEKLPIYKSAIFWWAQKAIKDRLESVKIHLKSLRNIRWNVTSWIGWFTFFFFSLEARIDRTSLSFIDPNSTNTKIETVNLYRFANFYTTPETNELNSFLLVGYHGKNRFSLGEKKMLETLIARKIPPCCNWYCFASSKRWAFKTKRKEENSLRLEQTPHRR